MQKSKKNELLLRYLAATIIPIILLCLTQSVFVYDQYKLYQTTRTELQGVHAIQSLYHSLIDLQKIRGLTQISLWSELPDVDRELAELKERFMNRFQKEDWLKLARQFEIEREATEVTLRAKELFVQTTRNLGTTDEIFDSYSSLITDLLQLMQLTANHSRLILDPELDTYYLIDVLVIEIPYLVEAIGRVRGMGSGLLSKRTVTSQEKDRLYTFQTAIKARMESIENAQIIITKTSPGLKSSLHLLPPELKTVIAKIMEECRCIQEGTECRSMAPEDFFHLATRAIDMLSLPYNQGIKALESRLKARLGKYTWHAAFILVGAAMVMILLLYFNRSFFLHNQKLHRALEELSITDQLTGLYNRRHFYSVFPREHRQALRHGEPLFIGLLDVDNFKKYNDTYGHPEGDRVLKAISGAMQQVLRRAGDYCFRIGGEEFCVLFPSRDEQTALLMAERIRVAIQSLGIEHIGNQPYGTVTVSIGLCQVPAKKSPDLQAVMSCADKGLYRAKEEGRNRVEKA